MRWWKYLLIGLGGYLFFLLNGLPAQHILGWTSADAQKPPFTYGNIKGTLWRGKMEAVRLQSIPVDKLKWRFTPTELLFGRLGFEVEINHIGQLLEGNVAIGMGDLYQLENVTGQLPAQMIPPLIDLGQIGVDGQVDLDLQHLTVEAQQVTSAEGKIKWLGSALLSPFALKVGDLQADLTTDENGHVKAKIKDMGGATSVDGELSLTMDGNFRVSGHIKPGTESDPRLGSALKAISKSQPDGSYRIDFSANL